MCRVVSLVVIPTTAEVLHVDGLWHHTDICKHLGLDRNKVFKPEISLANLSIDFVDGPIAFKRTLPDELVQELLVVLNKYGVSPTGSKVSDPTRKGDAEFLRSCGIAGVDTWQWEPRHHAAVERWKEKHLSDKHDLIALSEHTYEPKAFAQTLFKAPRHELFQPEWKRAFEKNPSPEWALMGL